MPFLIGGLAAGIGSGAVGAISSNHAQDSAIEQGKQAADLFKGLSPPDAADLQVELEKFQQTGQYTPRLQQLVQQAESNFSKVQNDPTDRAAQVRALDSLQGIADRGGRTLQQDAYLNTVRNQVNSDNAGRMGAIESSLAARGMGQPGGLALALMAQNAQNETQNENEASMKAAADAQTNALSAIEAEGSQAGQLRSQDFSQQAAKAQAQDAIDRFNAQLLHGTNAANTQTQNAADLYNQQVRQNISNMNTGVANEQILHNSNAKQQAFENQMAKTSGQANAMNGVANQYNKIGQTDAQMWGGLGQGFASAGAAGQLWANKSPSSSNNSDSMDKAYEDAYLGNY